MERVGSLADLGETRDAVTQEHFSLAIEKLDSLCSVIQQFSVLFTQYKHLIQLHRPLTILYAALGDNSSFLKYVTSVEKRLTQSFLSLSIKPVQRLPRYILLLKEMLKCIHRSVSVFDNELKDTLVASRMTLRETCIMIANCTLHCNNAMKEYEDLQKLHQLDRSFQNCNLKRKYNFVTIRKNRIFVLEGLLRRRHDRIGIRQYFCHVFSDVMLISVLAGNRGLKLKNILPLHENSGVACIPVPNNALWSAESSGEDCWFAIVSNKIMYFIAKSTIERDMWVSALNSVLKKNCSDHDVLCNAERLEIYNSSVDSYYERISSTTTAMEAAERSVCVTQAMWWQILCNIGDESLIEKVRECSAKAVSKMLLTFDKRKLGPLHNVFSDSVRGHFPIWFDYFFDCPKRTPKYSSAADCHPPSIVKVYLYHDILVAATLSSNDKGRSSYYFHINISSLQVQSQSVLSITLTDTSVESTKGIFHNLLKSGIRERTLVANSVEKKKTWLLLLQELISTKVSASTNKESDNYSYKVGASGTSAWRYQDRPSINWDNVDFT